MKKDVFDYELTGEEQILAHAIKYAVAVDDDIATDFNGVISPLLIYANFIEKTVDFQREIDFPRLVELTERAVRLCYEELARINAVQDSPMEEIERGVKIVGEIDVKAILQSAETEFYDFLVDCCKHPHER